MAATAIASAAAIGSNELRSEEAATILVGVRIALPLVLASTLAVLALFSFLSWIGRKVTAYRPIGIEKVAEEEERKVQSGAIKKKNKKPGEDDDPKRFPRKVALVLCFNLIALSYLADGLAFTFDTVFSRSGHLDLLDLGLNIAPLVLYSIIALDLIGTERQDATADAKYGIFAGAALIAMPIAAVSLAVTLSEIDLFNALHVIYLVTASFRGIFALLLASAFHPRFRVPAKDKGGEQLDERTPLLTAAVAPGTGHTVSSTKTEDAGAGEGETDEDDDDEEEEKPKIPKYDLMAVIHRIRRLLPFVAPLRSTLIRALVIACIVLTLLGNASRILLPRQWGKIVQGSSGL